MCVKWYTNDINETQKCMKGGAKVSNGKVTFKIDSSLEKAIEELKRERYYNKSYAELYRDLFSVALEVIEREV